VLIRPGSFDWREIPCATGGSAYAAPAGYIYASGPAGPAADIRVITSPNLVRAVQTALAGKGYYRGPASGFSNGETERGLARFQADNRLRPGWNKDTLRALGVPYPWGSPD
jgi:peptidoglycan hydrolase-like protein with peptidoglycan-binding domain